MKSVLITGGTGSFGKAFTSFLLANPDIERICIYSRGEHTQAEMAMIYTDPRMRFFIGDVRDLPRLTRAMQGVDTVVHAAALKRIEVGHYNPDEMVKTNILGAMNVIEAASAAGVKNVVALSTDKAYMPVSPYGQTKALAESLFLSANALHPDVTFTVVRYGNIWNAQGSVVPKWRAQLARDEVLQVTSPACTRFFMTVSEACQLVLDSIGKGKLVIPTELPAYCLIDLVRAVLYEVGKYSHGLDAFYTFDGLVKVTGLPKYEKLHECMDEGLCSGQARRMTVEELIEALRSC